MATTLTVPSTGRTNRTVAISGIDFGADASVTIGIAKADLSVVVVADAGGEFDATTVLDWRPSEPGRYTITANDGTNSKSSDITIYTTT